MYKKAIKKASNFIEPFFFGIKLYGSEKIIQGDATLIVLNDEGYFLTCRHVVEELLHTDTINKNGNEIVRKIRETNNKTEKEKIEKKLGVNADDVIARGNMFNFNFPNANNTFLVTFHEYLDLALVKMEGFSECKCQEFPVFAKNDPEQGESLCIYGFAFPEFDCFTYDKKTNQVLYNEQGNHIFPTFPIEGIMARGIMDERGIVSGFEMSVPGLGGQSGGPIISPNGVVYGIQSRTFHRDLGFNINMEVDMGTEIRKISDYPIMNFGVGITVSAIKDFLRSNKVKFNEEK